MAGGLGRRCLPRMQGAGALQGLRAPELGRDRPPRSIRPPCTLRALRKVARDYNSGNESTGSTVLWQRCDTTKPADPSAHPRASTDAARSTRACPLVGRR
eukprot:scaffold1235_cov358-Prasinococcus_capsulatus_cf.AAC.5